MQGRVAAHRDILRRGLNMRIFAIASASLVAIVSVPAAHAKAVDYDCALFQECADSGPVTDRRKTKGFSMAGTTAAMASSSNVKARTPMGTTRTQPQLRTNQRQAQMASASAASGVDLQLNFVTGSADLTPGAQAAASRLATAMMRPGRLSTRFTIEGHTDAVGSRESNLDLSRRRAEAVVGYLKAKGVDPKRFEVEGYGFDRPIAGTSALNGVNRRVTAKAIN